MGKVRKQLRWFTNGAGELLSEYIVPRLPGVWALALSGLVVWWVVPRWADEAVPGWTWASLLGAGGWLRLVVLWAAMPTVVRLFSAQSWMQRPGAAPGVATLAVVVVLDWVAAGSSAARLDLLFFTYLLAFLMFSGMVLVTLCFLAAVAVRWTARRLGADRAQFHEPLVHSWFKTYMRLAVLCLLSNLMYLMAEHASVLVALVLTVVVLAGDLAVSRVGGPQVVAVAVAQPAAVRQPVRTTPAWLDHAQTNRPSSNKLN